MGKPVTVAALAGADPSRGRSTAITIAATAVMTGLVFFVETREDDMLSFDKSCDAMDEY